MAQNSTNNPSSANFIGTASWWWFQTNAANNMRLNVWGGGSPYLNAMTVNQSGNVGIGTTVPGGLFTVGNNTFEVNSGGTATAVLFSGSGASLTNIGTSNMTNVTGTANGTTYLRGDNTWASVSGGSSGTVTSSPAGDVAYYQSTGTTVIGTSTLQIANGKVGDGTASPAALLHTIAGDNTTASYPVTGGGTFYADNQLSVTNMRVLS